MTGGRLRIGELSARSGVSARLLRYYEQQGLLAPCRDGNGYRSYTEEAVRLATQIRELLEAGMTTQIIREILPCVRAQDSVVLSSLSDEAFQQLRSHQLKIAARIECLSKTHRAIENYISAVRARSGA